jgi:tRNA dimethylallyltransferase
MPDIPADSVSFSGCWFLTGPTASGKTAVALELARRLDADVLSLDSMAVYRGMDIGTAKPTPAERAAVPHHLVDLCEPHEEFSVAQYLQAAAARVAEIRVRGRTPLFAGGTPLYLKALLRGLSTGPEPDWELRRRLLDEAAAGGSVALHRRLQAVDPQAAARLHPNDTRRLARALEVYERSGRPISAGQTQFAAGRRAEDCRVFVLQWPREELHRRIELRVEAMLAAGWIDEVRRLLDDPRGWSRTARQAVGYPEVAAYVRGERSLADTIALVKTRTRQFAKRQLTWFRSLSECRWIEVQEPLQVEAVAQRIEAAGGRGAVERSSGG